MSNTALTTATELPTTELPEMLDQNHRLFVVQNEMQQLLRIFCQFLYKNYEISVVSSSQHGTVDVVVFKEKNSNEIVFRGMTVEQCIDWINQQVQNLGILTIHRKQEIWSSRYICCTSMKCNQTGQM